MKGQEAPAARPDLTRGNAGLALALVVAYLALYLAHPALPGNNPAHPLGWWGWWDQSQYLRSARALAQGNLAPSEHWYPPAYALLASAFARLWPAHPFVLVNLVCLLGTAWLFVGFALRAGVGAPGASVLFLLAAVPVATDWVVPWTSTPTALALWAILRLAADHLSGQRRLVLLGFAAGSVAVLRPADLVVPAVVIAWLLAREARAVLAANGLSRRAATMRLAGDILRLGLGGLLPVLAITALHVMIHGPRPSPYMLVSGDIGFSLHAYGWKAFNLLIEPRAWWNDGTGLLQRAPWIGVAVLLLPFALRAGAIMWLLALALFVHLALYVAYVDLLPTGLWRYRNVHYLKWALPGFALLAWLGLRNAWAAIRDVRTAGGWRHLGAFTAVLPLALVLSLRLLPEQVDPEAGGTARAAMLTGVQAGMMETYFEARNAVTDQRGVARNIPDLRFHPTPAGTRILWLRRDAMLPIAEIAFPAAGPVPASSVTLYRSRLEVGMPCWLPPFPCKRGF